MVTGLSASEAGALCRLLTDLTQPRDRRDLREVIGVRLLDLLRADHFASYVWNPDSHAYEDGVSLNMSPDNLSAYVAHFQFRDPITSRLRQRARATHVNEILPQAELERTEFFNDFLIRDGLCHGMNFHAHDGAAHLGDIRIWRGRHRSSFDRRDVELLGLIGPAFCNALKTARRLESLTATPAPLRAGSGGALDGFGLTPRERSVAAELLSGKRDSEIALALGIGPATVRSHLGQLFAKTGTAGRAAFIARFARPH